MTTKSKPIVYLSGPIAGCSFYEIHAWRDNFKEKYGVEYCLDPARRVYGDDGANWERTDEIVENDLDDISNSDVSLIFYSRPTAGTLIENMYAYNWGKTIVVVCKDDAVFRNLSPWIIYHADYITMTFVEAMAFINGEFEIV